MRRVALRLFALAALLLAAASPLQAQSVQEQSAEDDPDYVLTAAQRAGIDPAVMCEVVYQRQRAVLEPTGNPIMDAAIDDFADAARVMKQNIRGRMSPTEYDRQYAIARAAVPDEAVANTLDWSCNRLRYRIAP
jgi:hypothetical protein